MKTRRELLASCTTLWLARAAVATEAVKPETVGGRLRQVDELSRALLKHEISHETLLFEWNKSSDSLAK